MRGAAARHSCDLTWHARRAHTPKQTWKGGLRKCLPRAVTRPSRRMLILAEMRDGRIDNPNLERDLPQTLGDAGCDALGKEQLSAQSRTRVGGASTCGIRSSDRKGH